MDTEPATRVGVTRSPTDRFRGRVKKLAMRDVERSGRLRSAPVRNGIAAAKPRRVAGEGIPPVGARQNRRETAGFTLSSGFCVAPPEREL
ncbi:hypothetical protein GCM10009000_022980 [Halobacterium noricense]